MKSFVSVAVGALLALFLFQPSVEAHGRGVVVAGGHNTVISSRFGNRVVVHGSCRVTHVVQQQSVQSLYLQPQIVQQQVVQQQVVQPMYLQPQIVQPQIVQPQIVQPQVQGTCPAQQLQPQVQGTCPALQPQVLTGPPAALAPNLSIDNTYGGSVSPSLTVAPTVSYGVTYRSVSPNVYANRFGQRVVISNGVFVNRFGQRSIVHGGGTFVNGPNVVVAGHRSVVTVRQGGLRSGRVVVGGSGRVVVGGSGRVVVGGSGRVVVRP